MTEIAQLTPKVEDILSNKLIILDCKMNLKLYLVSFRHPSINKVKLEILLVVLKLMKDNLFFNKNKKKLLKINF